MKTKDYLNAAEKLNKISEAINFIVNGKQLPVSHRVIAAVNYIDAN